MIDHNARYSTLFTIRTLLYAVMLSCLYVPTAVSMTFPGADLYVAGREAEESARYADAVTSYNACAKVDRELGPYARVRAAACRAKAGDRNGAIEQWQALLKDATDEPWAAMARAELALVLQRQNQHADAIRQFDQIFAKPLTPKALDSYRLAYGDSLIAAADPKKNEAGFALFESMLSEARTRTQRLAAARRLAKSPDPRQRIDAAKALVYSAEWGDAAGVLNETEPVLPGKRSEYAATLAYLHGRINLAVDSDKEAARRALLAVAKDHPGTEPGRLALMHTARSYFSAGEEPERKPRNEPASAAQLRETYRKTAAQLFDLMVLQMPDTEETSEALWWLGSRHAEHDDKPAEMDAAIKTFVRLADTCPTQKRAPEALYRAATLQCARGQDTAAEPYLRTIVEEYPDSPIAPAAAYECARIQLAQKEAGGAGKYFQRAVDVGGVGNYYAHRAAQRLVEIGVAGKHPGKLVPTPGAGGFLRTIPIDVRFSDEPGPEPWIERTRFFASHGYEEAEWEVLAQADALLDAKKAGSYLTAIADTGLAATASYIMNRTQWGLVNDRPLPEALPALYPRAYWDTVRTTAHETNADPMLILAIARQESLFQARIESHAGATGVMQLMPSTASWLAKVDPEVGAGHALTLEKPASSLRLGAYYYRHILGKNGGNEVFAIASYNAGPGNVSKWRNNLNTRDLDSFIEAIPFDETRDFVKKVLGNHAAYHSIYGEQDRLAERVSR